ncbi:MAG: AAA family ATPase [Deltaproteobacteria bacterium]|nr:AAA family ATPase [Deltaproteobacteria bacterium]MBK8713358.1 AAA family ATPase [Deltaproteobacteria bacterium]MBP7289298.1 AAA family ATPase [Nannocystaceae bacterium]
MKLARLEVHAFKCVASARLELGPGLNVLYGPNDLGKTSLADAVRAVLLLPSSSAQRSDFESWQLVASPHVRLWFEHRERHWRVDKTWGEGSRAAALLEVSNDGAVWSKSEAGRAVDAELRKMLSWGVREPGGKGAPKGLPSSFITTALLGASSRAEELFAADLGKDTDTAGRERLTEALQSFAEDPVFKHMLTTAQGKVEQVKDARGNWRRGRGSPLGRIGDEIRELQRELADSTESAEHGEAVEQAAARHRERRTELLQQLERDRAALDQLQRAWQAAAHAREVVAAHDRAHAAWRVAHDERERVDALAGELTQLRTQVQAANEAADAAVVATSEARARLQAALAARQAAQGEGEAGARERHAALEHRIATMASAHERLETRQDRLREVRAQQDAAAAQAQQASAAIATAGARQRASQAAAAALAPMEQMLARHDRALAVARWREAQAEVAQQQQRAAEEAQLRARAQTQRQQVADALAQLDRRGLPDAATLEQLRTLEAGLQRARDRAAVGFAVAFALPRDAAVTIDDAATRSLREGDVAATRTMTIALAEGGTLTIAAGSSALRDEVVAAEQAWQRDGAPVLAQLAMPDTAALQQALEHDRSERARLQLSLAEASALEREAEHLVVDAQRQAQSQARRDALAAVLAGRGGPARDDEFASSVAELLEQQAQQLAEVERQREAVREAEAARALAVERAEVARRDAELAQARVLDLLAQLGLSAGTDLGATLAELDDELSGLRHELAALERERDAARASDDARHAALAEQLQQAEHAQQGALAREQAALAHASELRERAAALGARLEDARQRTAAVDLEGLQRAAADAIVARDALPPIEPVTESLLEHARARLEATAQALTEVTAELQKAEGSLEQLGGAGLRERAEEAQQALVRATQSERELQRDYDAWQLLRDTLRTVEAEQGQHLGNALAGAVEQRLRRLTEGRYARLELDRDLRAEGLRVAGSARAFEVLSAGLREQLATLVRVAIAEHLRQVVVLDDHLAQTDPQRVDFFRDLLREVAQRVQILVLTCRPLDYLDARELPEAGTAIRDSEDGRVRAIDLSRVIARVAAD